MCDCHVRVHPGIMCMAEGCNCHPKPEPPLLHQINSEEIALMRIRLAKITMLHNQLSDALIKATVALVDINNLLDTIEHDTLDKEIDA